MDYPQAGETMGDIDALSRRRQLQSLLQHLRFDFRRSPELQALFAEIDPSAPPKNVRP